MTGLDFTMSTAIVAVLLLNIGVFVVFWRAAAGMHRDLSAKLDRQREAMAAQNTGLQIEMRTLEGAVAQLAGHHTDYERRLSRLETGIEAAQRHQGVQRARIEEMRTSLAHLSAEWQQTRRSVDWFVEKVLQGLDDRYADDVRQRMGAAPRGPAGE